MLPDESELLDKMPLVMRTAIAVDINLTTFQKIDLFKVPFPVLTAHNNIAYCSLDMKSNTCFFSTGM